MGEPEFRVTGARLAVAKPLPSPTSMRMRAAVLIPMRASRSGPPGKEGGLPRAPHASARATHRHRTQMPRRAMPTQPRLGHDHPVRPAPGRDGARTPQRAHGPRRPARRCPARRTTRTLHPGRRHTARLRSRTRRPTTTHTSGAVEGNVTGIKLLKRQMYGGANFGLLRRRILLSP